jgi:hypothetical protein
MHFFIFHRDKHAGTNHECVTGKVLNTRRLVVILCFSHLPPAESETFENNVM